MCREIHPYLLKTLLSMASILSSTNRKAYSDMCFGAGELVSGVAPCHFPAVLLSGRECIADGPSRCLSLQRASKLPSLPKCMRACRSAGPLATPGNSRSCCA